MGQSSYVPQEYHNTVLGMVEEAQAEVRLLAEECAFAASRFPSPEHPKAIAFAKAAADLRLMILDVTMVPQVLQHRVVMYEGQRTRRTAHKMARWCRATNLARGLQASADVVQAFFGYTHKPVLSDMLEQAAVCIRAVDFPPLYDKKGAAHEANSLK